MHIYVSGIGGVAMGPLARIARDLGHTVTGSNDVENQYTASFQSEQNIRLIIGQDSKTIAAIHKEKPIDWFVYSSAIQPGHPELAFAQENNITHTKRDGFINEVLLEKQLKMLAVSGTHGKTGTTGMIIWACKKLKIPISYSIGTNISFGPNGQYDPESQYFVYEADEYDRNMLHFMPYCSIITSLDYDHPDIYPSVEDYKEAFREFTDQSHCVFTWSSVSDYAALNTSTTTHLRNDSDLTESLALPGLFQRRNAQLVADMMQEVFSVEPEKVITILNDFPGTERRLEKLRDNLYTDYAHHPNEIRATLDAALELNKHVVIVYQPHQNMRQHQVKHLYKDAFTEVDKVYWLPTYLSRDDDELELLSPEKLIAELRGNAPAEVADMNNKLIEDIRKHQADGDLVLLMSAGNLDAWARGTFL